MNFNDLGRLVRKGLKAHSPLILSIAAGVGTVATAYLAGRASFKAAEVIREHEENVTYSDKKEKLKERTKLVWKLYIPPAIATIGTIGCIAGSNRIGTQKVLAAQSALAVSQQALTNYRDKVVEEFGAHKDRAIRDKIAEERLHDDPPCSQDAVLIGSGTVLCCELFTMRYFNSDMETLRKAQNDINAKLNKHDYATLDDFYYAIHVAGTSYSGQVGWKSDRLMELVFTTVLTDDNRPCLAFDYNYTISF